MTWSATRTAPVRRSALDRLQKFYFGGGPAPFPERLTLCAPEAAPTTETRGAAKRLSPEELDWALLFAIRGAIRNGAAPE
eukprot:2510867-Alexandrium_andersonii.AAC.1